MSKMIEKLKTEHQYCDEIFCQFEELVDMEQWDKANVVWDQFTNALKKHMEFEEIQLFKQFEISTHSSSKSGPTAIMKLEHDQIREYLSVLSNTLKVQDKGAILDAADNLMILIQQHAMTEESILYPLCDQHLKPNQFNLSA